MAKKEVKVTFRTITPLWTGDAWQENTEIRPSSLLGSLRFWFEVICYFSGICEGKHFNSVLGRFEKEVNRENLKKCLMENGADFETQIECLVKQDIPIPSIIFGTTNWKSLMEIKDIKPINDYCFGNKLNLPSRICISKSNEEIKENDDCPKRSNSNWSVFYFPNLYFYGQFEVLFNVEEKILEPIFYPLLTFMDKYGYWGGKWNIGYGRLRVENIEVNSNSIDNWKKDDFEDFEKICFSWKNLIKIDTLNINSKPFQFLKKFLSIDSFYCKNEIQIVEKTKNIPKKIKLVLIEDLNGNGYQEIISEMLKIKVYIRNCLRHICEEDFKNCFEIINGKNEFKEDKEIKYEIENNNKDKKIIKIKCRELSHWKSFRHRLLGEQGEGSKILPYIDEESGDIKAGFLSIAGLLNLEKEGENNG